MKLRIKNHFGSKTDGGNRIYPFLLFVFGKKAFAIYLLCVAITINWDNENEKN